MLDAGPGSVQKTRPFAPEMQFTCGSVVITRPTPVSSGPRAPTLPPTGQGFWQRHLRLYPYKIGGNTNIQKFIKLVPSRGWRRRPNIAASSSRLRQVYLRSDDIAESLTDIDPAMLQRGSERRWRTHNKYDYVIVTSTRYVTLRV